MAGKNLTLRLFYKNDEVHYAKSEKDFNNKFTIGSSPQQFWQILSRAFPSDFTLITRENGKYVMHLRKGMDIDVKKGDLNIPMQELKSSRMLKGSKLYLDERTQGTLRIDDTWKIEYAYTTPHKRVLSPADRALVSKLSHKMPASPEERFTMAFLLLAFFVTIVGIVIFQATYEPEARTNIVEQVQRRAQIANLAAFELQQQETGGGKEEAEEAEEASEVDAETEVAEAQQISDQQMSSELGFSVAGAAEGGYDIGEATVSTEDIFRVDTIGDLVTTGGGGARSTSASDAMAQLQSQGSSAAMSSDVSLDAMLTGIQVGGGGSAFEQVDLGALDVGSIQTTQITSNVQFGKIKAAKYGKVTRLDVDNINLKELSPADKSALANIRNVVNAYKPQIMSIYRSKLQTLEIYGTLEITLYIDKSGKVEEVELKPLAGSFFGKSVDFFLVPVRNNILRWRIPVKQNRPFTFRMKFFK
ncbi:MAG: hypothetical protein K8S56_04920 [Candidatus Cloacimonetes bacterium]|nr:hypothetical protein [Candidatus Cloacimonadota bacterium]